MEKQNVKNCIEIGLAEADIMAFKYRAAMCFSFCQDLCSNLIITLRSLSKHPFECARVYKLSIRDSKPSQYPSESTAVHVWPTGRYSSRQL